MKKDSINIQIPYRLGNITLRVSHTLGINGTESKAYFDIVKWYPNEYYGKKDKFEYDEKRKMYYKKTNEKPWWYVSPSCFDHPESCFSLANIDWDKEYPDVRTVGPRPFKLNDEEYKNFTDIVKYFYNLYDKHYEVLNSLINGD